MTVLSRFRGLEGTGTGRYRSALEHVEHEQARPWAALWRDTAEGCGLVHKVVVPAGVTVVVPVIRGLRRDQGRPLTLVAEMLHDAGRPACPRADGVVQQGQRSDVGAREADESGRRAGRSRLVAGAAARRDPRSDGQGRGPRTRT